MSQNAKVLTVFIFVNEIGNAECCSNLETNTAVLLHKTHRNYHTNTTTDQVHTTTNLLAVRCLQ